MESEMTQNLTRRDGLETDELGNLRVDRCFRSREDEASRDLWVATHEGTCNRIRGVGDGCNAEQDLERGVRETRE